MRKSLALLILLVGLLLAGCSPLVQIEQPQRTSFTALKSGTSVGQTFVARYDGLQRVVIYLRPAKDGAGTLRAHLRVSPQDSQDLGVDTLPLSEISAPGFYRFNFPTQNDSANRYYYLLLEVEGDGSLRVGSADGNTYLNGALYQGGTSQDTQATFRLIYDSRQAILGVAREALSWLALLLVGIFLFILPGWALLAGLHPAWGGLSWGERLGLSAGLGLGIYPLFFLWTGLVGLHMGAVYAWLPPIAGLLYLLWKNRHSLKPQVLTAWRLPRFHWADLALLLILALIAAVRLWAIRGLDAPMWGDSYQHTLMAQLLVDHGGMFNSWQPYADLQTFTYHFGFHTLVAAYHWVSGLSVTQSVLWVGQILNILAVFGLYLLAMRIGRSRWAGVLAVAVAGLLAPMPNFYLNWGRYTQLAGMAILPAMVLLAWEALEAKEINRGRFALAWIALGGLALTHFRVLMFAALFFLAYFILNLRKGQIRALVLRHFWVGIGAAILFLPWFIHVFAGQILNIFAAQLTTLPGQSAASIQELNSIGNIFDYLPELVWLLFILALAWGLWRREKGAALVGLWWFFILLAANPQWFRLPGAGALGNFTVFIAAYFPASLLIGAGLGWLIERFHPLAEIGYAKRFLSLGASLVGLVLLVGLGAWGARQRLADFQVSSYALVLRPDLRAAAWIQENISPQARFLVNSFPAYGGTSVVGSDGGWWLPLLAHRQTTLPPLTYASEKGPRPDYQAWVNALTAEILDQGIQSPQVLDDLIARGVTHVYIGQQQGRVNYAGPVLEPSQLAADPHFHPIYHQDRVWIFELVR